MAKYYPMQLYPHLAPPRNSNNCQMKPIQMLALDEYILMVLFVLVLKRCYISRNIIIGVSSKRAKTVVLEGNLQFAKNKNY